MLRSIFLFLLVLPLIVACPNSNRPAKAANELYANNMNFKKWKKIRFYDVSFSIPKKFEIESDSYFTMRQKKSKQLSIESLSLYFSIEVFDNSEATNIQYVNNEKSNLYAVQKYYMLSVLRRLNEYGNDGYRLSEIKGIKKNCLSQVVIQNFTREYKWDSDYSNTYFIATKKIKNSYFVFQFVGRSENLKYLYDDFLKIVHSAK